MIGKFVLVVCLATYYNLHQITMFSLFPVKKSKMWEEKCKNSRVYEVQFLSCVRG